MEAAGGHKLSKHARLQETQSVSESGFQFTDLFFSRKLWQRIRKPLISTGLFVILSTFIIYLLLPNLVLARLVEPLHKFIAFFNLAQGYGVFAPNPTTKNSHIVGVVFYTDGSSRLYEFPRLDRISMTNKLWKERYRKFLEDNIPQKRNAHLVNDVARFVARETDIFPKNSSTSNRPETVMLLNYYAEAPPIHAHKHSPSHFNMRVLCTYSVTREDLQ